MVVRTSAPLVRLQRAVLMCSFGRGATRALSHFA